MISKYADLNIGHVTNMDAKFLGSAVYLHNPLEGVGMVYRYDHGVFISLGEEDEPVSEEFSEHFKHLVKCCRLAGCTLIRLDKDAPYSEHLPRFDW